jgi:Transcription initiation factor TFIID subunit A
MQVDPLVKVDPYTEDFLLDVADGFLESVIVLFSNLLCNEYPFLETFWYAMITYNHRSDNLYLPPFYHFQVASFACNLAKHRKSSTLELKDLLLPLGTLFVLSLGPKNSKKF